MSHRVTATHIVPVNRSTSTTRYFGTEREAVLHAIECRGDNNNQRVLYLNGSTRRSFK